MPGHHFLCNSRRHGGQIVVTTAVMMVVMLGMAALAVDVGRLYMARTELQVSADASALAGAGALLNEYRLKGTVEMMNVITAAREQAAIFAVSNRVLNDGPEVDVNSGNSPEGDVVLGHLDDLADLDEPLLLTDPPGFNAVQVRVRRNSIRNGPIPLLFARIWGFQSADVGAEAVAAFDDGVVGYRATWRTGNAELLPLALHEDSWNELLDAMPGGDLTCGDNYAYDPETGQVTPGSDGIPELNLYPGAGQGQLPPGNFGTVDIGSSNNSTADIARQILYGVSEEDLAYFGGELSLAGGPIELNGDTGLSAGVKDELAAIRGKSRAIPLFDHVSNPGNNAMFRVIGFAGIRIMNVKLTGPMSKKNVITQPAYVVDDAVITETGSNLSYFVYEPVRLVR